MAQLLLEGGIKMNQADSPITSLTLIRSACEEDPKAWQKLCDIYSPLVFAWARRSGLQENDANDIVQDVFCIVFKTLPRFRRDRIGDSFRGWLWTITRNEVRGWYRKQSTNAGQARGGSETINYIAAIPDWIQDETSNSEIASDAETESKMMRRAAEAIRDDFAPHTWQAFWRATVLGQAAVDIAADLNMSAGAVRQAKFRVLARLKEFLE